MEDRDARQIGESNFLKKEFLFFFRVLEIVVSIFWMEASVSVESGMD